MRVSLSGAQYYPLLACPLYRSHLMQLHKAAQAARCLPLPGVMYPLICMQIHAPYACTALYKAGWSEKGLSKGKQRAKKAAGVAAASGINVTGRMNHSARLFAPDSAALEPPAVVPAEAGR